MGADDHINVLCACHMPLAMSSRLGFQRAARVIAGSWAPRALAHDAACDMNIIVRLLLAQASPAGPGAGESLAAWVLGLTLSSRGVDFFRFLLSMSIR